jgi:hypothetical protein
MDMLNDSTLTGNIRMAVIYRSERKKIIENQIQLTEWLINVIKESYKLEEMKNRGEEMQSIHQTF